MSLHDFVLCMILWITRSFGNKAKEGGHVRIMELTSFYDLFIHLVLLMEYVFFLNII